MEFSRYSRAEECEPRNQKAAWRAEHIVESYSWPRTPDGTRACGACPDREGSIQQGRCQNTRSEPPHGRFSSGESCKKARGKEYSRPGAQGSSRRITANNRFPRFDFGDATSHFYECPCPATMTTLAHGTAGCILW